MTAPARDRRSDPDRERHSGQRRGCGARITVRERVVVVRERGDDGSSRACRGRPAGHATDRRAARIQNPRFSPDGHTIAVEVAETKGNTIWLYDLAGRTFTRLADGGASPNGRETGSASSSGRRTMAKSASGGSPRTGAARPSCSISRSTSSTRPFCRRTGNGSSIERRRACTTATFSLCRSTETASPSCSWAARPTSRIRGCRPTANGWPISPTRAADSRSTFGRSRTTVPHSGEQPRRRGAALGTVGKHDCLSNVEWRHRIRRGDGRATFTVGERRSCYRQPTT